MPAENLRKVDVTDEKIHLTKCDFGTSVKALLVKKSGLEKKIEDNLKVFLKASVYHLIQTLPIDNRILKDAKFFGHSVRHESGTVNAISRLTLNVASALGDSFHRLFHLEAESTKYDLIDIVKRQLMECQTEIIPEHFYLKDQQSTSHCVQPSYWRAAYGMAGVELATKDEESSLKSIDEYWTQIHKIVNEEGKVKYNKLFVLAKCVLTLSHGNADPERGFSINKYLLDIHDSSTGEDTLEALLMIKDYLIVHGAVKNIVVDRKLIKSCSLAYSKYEEDLKQKKEQNEKEEAARKLLKIVASEEDSKVAADKRSAEKLKSIDRDINVLKAGVNVAERIVQEGNPELASCLQASTLNRKSLQAAQSKIDMGVQRKQELDMEIEMLKKKCKSMQTS